MILGKMIATGGADVYTNKFMLGDLTGSNLQLSTNSGTNWSTLTTSFTTNPNFAISSDGKYITVAERTTSGRLYVSSDGGASFTLKYTCGGAQQFSAVSMSETGQYQLAVIYAGGRMLSTDYGNTWTTPSGTVYYMDAYVSTSGQYMITASSSGTISKSVNYGSSFSALTIASQNYWSACISNDGQYITAVVNNEFIYISSNGGSSWSQIVSSQYWSKIRMSDSGQYQTAIHQSTGYWYYSTNYGVNWTNGATSAGWQDISMNKTGQYQYMTRSGTGYRVYRSTNYGATFSAWTSTVASTWRRFEVCK